MTTECIKIWEIYPDKENFASTEDQTHNQRDKRATPEPVHQRGTPLIEWVMETSQSSKLLHNIFKWSFFRRTKIHHTKEVYGINFFKLAFHYVDNIKTQKALNVHLSVSLLHVSSLYCCTLSFSSFSSLSSSFSNHIFSGKLPLLLKVSRLCRKINILTLEWNNMAELT